MKNLTAHIDTEGVALITLNVPGRGTNTLSESVTTEFAVLIAELAANAAVRGIVITSDKADFCAGADLAEVEDEIAFCQAAKSPEELRRAGERLWRIAKLFRKIETCGKPVVAAINGSALGGGLELALACHQRIVADERGIKLGFPEVTFGLMPGAGGTQRLPRLISIKAALPLLLEGKPVDPARAKQLGIVNAVVAAEALTDAAKHWIKEHGTFVSPWDRPDFRYPGGGPYTPAGTATIAEAIARVRGQTFGNYPAQENILKAVYEGALAPFDVGLRIEERYSLDTARTAQAGSMVRTLFKSMQAVSKGSSRPKEHSTSRIDKVAVLGAGIMGAGIAHVQAMAGIETVLIDIDVGRAERGKSYCTSLLQQAAAKGKMTVADVNEIAARIRPTADYSEVHDADLIIEAVFEDRKVKAEAIAKAKSFAGARTVFGSNTSSLPIDSLADSSGRPEDFIGIHFFSPVDRMRLVEIITGRRTGSAALAIAMDYAVKIGKVPIVVNDSRAFYTSRVFGTYLAEGFTMLSEGIAPAIIENAGRMTSMPRGPLELGDDVGLDVLYRADRQADVDLGVSGDSRPEQRVVATLVEQQRHGRKVGKGFYDYPTDGGPKVFWTGLGQIAAPRINSADPCLLTDIKDRLLYRQAIEAVRCVEEQVISDARQVDVGGILGWGFPQWTGGPLSFIDSVGTAAFIDRAQMLADQYGPRFAPPALLRQMAERGVRFY